MEKISLEKKIDTFYFRLSLKDNDLLSVHKDIPDIYSESTLLYSQAMTKIAQLTKRINRDKSKLYRKYRQNTQFDLKKGEIEEYYLTNDKSIRDKQFKIDVLEIHITRLEKLFQLLNNMSFITGNFIKIQEKRGVKL
jgi:hypothetical protein